MKINNRTHYTLKDFRLYFKPKSIFFLKKNTANLRIYLEKNVQVIGKIEQPIPPIAPNLKYSLSQFNKAIQFRVVADTIPNYLLTVYQLTDAGIQQFIQSSQLKISKFLQEFYQEFLNSDDQLYRELKSKQNLTIAQIWRTISNNFTKKVLMSSVRFNKIDAILEFNLEPLHRYDQLVREADIEQQRRRQKKQKKQQNHYVKSRSIPQFANVGEKVDLRRGYSAFQPPLRPFSFKSNKTGGNKEQIKQQLKHFSLKIPDIVNRDNELEGNSSLKQNSNINIKNSNENIKIIDEKNQQHENDEQLQIPRIQHKKYLLTAEIKSNQKNKRIQSQDNINMGVGQKLATLFTLILSSFLVVFLMHPLPKR